MVVMNSVISQELELLLSFKWMKTMQSLTITRSVVSDLSSSSCTDKQKLKGCVAGCSSHRNATALNECQLKCSSCINETESTSMECDSCDFTACMVGCNSTVNLNRLAISLGNTNVTLLPVPEKLYFYKTNIQINDDIVQSAAITTREQSGPFTFIIKVFTFDGNTTSYRLLHDPNTDMLDLSTIYSVHCKPANISVALVNSNGISEYSTSTEMCISAFFPKAANKLQSCFGEEVGLNISKKFIIDLKWELPADVTYLEGFMLNVIGDHRKNKCKSLNMITLEKDQTRYTLGKKEQIDQGCQYQISLISIPAYNNINTVVVTQSTKMSGCDQSIRPNRQISLIQQYNYNGKSNYSIHLLLESDPAALQALDGFRIAISRHETFIQSADKFPSYLFPTDHNNSMMSFGSECFSDKVHKEYLCSDNCDSLQYKDTDREKCIQECEDASEYRISLRKSFPSNESLTIWFKVFYKNEYNYRCRYNEIRITSLNVQCYPSTPPRNLSLLSSSIKEGILSVNLTWIPPEYSHGYIDYYGVEFYYNDTEIPLIVEKRTENNETVLKDMDIDQIVVIRVRADNGCKNYSWSSTLTINPADFFPSQQPSSDDPPYHRYYIASGVIVGCMVFAVVVLAIIIICCCYVCQANDDRIKIDESIIGPGTPIRITNRRSDIIESIELPIDHWEMSPDNVVMDQSTFLACGNFGEVYKGKLKTATKSQNESYLAGKLVAVKILQEDAGGDLKQDFLQEINLMKKVAEGGNPFVVNMIGCCTIEEPLALIMEFVSGGNLLEFLKAHRRKPSQEMDKTAAPYLEPRNEYSHLQPQQIERKPLNVSELLTFAYQIACGMEYLGGKGIIHRDLACRNVLVGENNAMKIADFGLSKHLYDDPVYVKNQDGKLPIRWMAIEAILERKYSVQSDVWSFGIVIWEIFTFGGYPYPSLTNIEVVDAILKGYRMECPSNYLCPPELYALAERCWYADPEQRPSFNTLTSEISNMIPDYDPSQYVEVARYDPYCEMHSAKKEKRFFSSDNLDEEEEDKL
ncbi:uncharacterized protein [Dysidea avara]|uniref:uncharacterized protein isoform X2 n=1 Tax=Dysidea avara TaxID=196820 RepID=UPI003318AB22